MDVGNEFGLPQEQQPNLPPPGDERREVLAQRKDDLQQQIDEKSNQHIAIDPAKMEVDREVRSDLEDGYMVPSNADPAFQYLWVQCKHPVDHPSRMVDRKLAETVEVNGKTIRPWEIVGRDHKEARESFNDVLGCCTIGDVLLMRCRKDYYALMELEKRRRTHERSFGLDSNLVDIALEHGTQAGHHAYNKHRTNANQSLFGNDFQMKLDHALRTGNLPGMEIRR